MKPTLKAPRSVLLKLRYDGPASKFAFNFNLRRYIAVPLALLALAGCSAVYTTVLVSGAVPAGSAYARRDACAAVEAGAYTRLLCGST